MKYKECPSCAMEVEAKANKCPICGYEFPKHPLYLKWVAILFIILILLFLIF